MFITVPFSQSKINLTIKLLKFISIGILLVVLSSCAIIPLVPTEEQISKADFGFYPENYKEIVKNYYSKSLFDPYSAHYIWLKLPIRGYISTYNQLHFGYLVHIELNAKNRMGGYVGSKAIAVLVKNNHVIGTRPFSYNYSLDKEFEVSKDYVGLGVVLDRSDINIIITTVINNSPAYKSGLRIEDKIVKINDENIIGISLEEASQMLKGEQGEKIMIGVIRADNDTILEFEIARDLIKKNIP